MIDSVFAQELYPSEEEILCKHVHDLTGCMVTQTISDPALSIAPRHTYVENFIFIPNYIHAWLIRYLTPNRSGESDWFRKPHTRLDVHLLDA
jgi:hypothetical protein